MDFSLALLLKILAVLAAVNFISVLVMLLRRHWDQYLSLKGGSHEEK